ncbi:hypothetical protein VTH82DRAFT_2362 [Thermothelomyces myriococcoides]
MTTMDESGQRATGTKGVKSEAALSSTVKSSQSTAGSLSPPVAESLTGRSSSMKSGSVGRKTSFKVREWAKRSNSSRTAPTTGTSASESLKPHIKHLGGGRLEQVEVRGTANNTTLLAPFPKRGLRSRASSIDSRVTQWVDFYPSSSENSNSQGKSQATASGDDKNDGKHLKNQQPSQQEHQRKHQEEWPWEQQWEQQRERPSSNSDLRPAPLRIPSSEKRGGAGTATPPPKQLERKDSKWKPLPTLPAQRANGAREVSGSGPTTPAAARKAETRGPQGLQGLEPVEQPPTEQGKDERSKSSEPPPLPTFRFDSPPPTPDSSAGGAARARGGDQQGWAQKDEGGRGRPAGEFRRPLQQDRAREGRDEKSAGTAGTVTGTEPGPGTGESDSSPKLVVRHTREERIWLHVNYRGEAPFLQAWGLDIANPADRLEGLAILRDLMQAEVLERREHGNAACYCPSASSASKTPV